MNNHKRYLRVLTGVVIVAITVSMVWAQRELHLDTGDILEDAMPESDPYMAQYTRVKNSDVYGSDVLAIGVVGQFTPALVAQYDELGWRLEEKIPGGYFSLTTTPNLEVVNGGKRLNKPYYLPTPEKLDYPTIVKTIETLTNDNVMRGVLFKFYQSVQWGNIPPNGVVLMHLIIPEKGIDEDAIYDAVKSILEERETTGLWRFVDYDINPTEKWSNVIVVSWLAGRPLVSRMLPTENLKQVSLGMIAMALLFGWFAGSIKVATVGTLLVMCGLIWMRGFIPLIDHFVLFKERAYIIIGAASTLVPGTSIALATLMYMLMKDQVQRGVLGRLIVCAVIVGAGNQLSLYVSFDIRAIKELAIYGFCGVLSVGPLCYFGMHAAFTRAPSEKDRDNMFTRTIERSTVLAGRHQPTLTAATVVLALSVTLGVISFPFIPKGTDAAGLIRGTFVERSFQTANQLLGWNDGFAVLVQPTKAIEGKAYHNVEFLNASVMFADWVDQLESVTVSGNIHRQVIELSYGYYGRLPQSEREAKRIFFDIKNSGAAYGTIESLYFDGGFQLFPLAYFGTSEEVRVTRAAIETLAEKFPNLQVQFGSMSSLYARTAEKVVTGKLWNLGTQTPWNWLGFVLSIWWVNRYLKKQGVLTNTFLSPIKAGCVMTLPFLFSTSLFFVLMALLGINMDQANAAILNMAANAAIDFTLYWGGSYAYWIAKTGQHKVAKTETFRERAQHTVMDALLNCVCFAPLFFSGFKTIAELGWQVPTMLLLIAFAVLFFTDCFFKHCIVRQERTSPKGGKPANSEVVTPVRMAA